MTAREISGTAFRVGRYTLIGSGLRHSGEARVSARGKIASRPVGRFLVASSPASPSKVSYMSTGHGAPGRFDPASSGFTVKRQGNTPRDRVGRDKRNGFSTYQVLCTSVGPTPAPACFQRRATWGRARRGTAKARGEGPGGRVNGSHGLLPFAAPHTRSRHQDWEPAGGPARSTSFYSPQRYPGYQSGSVVPG